MLYFINKPSYVLDVKQTAKTGIRSYVPRKPSVIEKLYFNLLFWPIVSPILGYVNSKRQITKEILSNITECEVANVNHKDYPDFVDAYIYSATWKNSLTPLTEKQLDQLNDKFGDFVYEQVWDTLH